MMQLGLGANYKMSKTWKFKASVWFLQFAQDGALSQTAERFSGTDKDIGTEIDLWATWTIMKALKMDFVFSYLMAGDALDEVTAPLSAEDPWELGAQLSLKF